MLTPENLKIAYEFAIPYAVAPRLLNYTVAIVAASIVARIVVLDTIGDAKLNEVHDLLGYIMPRFYRNSAIVIPEPTSWLHPART